MRLALPVREFVAPLEPTGSIDARRALATEEDPMALGARLHAKVQRRLAQEGPVRCELPVLRELGGEAASVLVRGRIDVLALTEPEVVEEIKTTLRPALLLEDLAAPGHPYVLQALVYAWLRWRDTERVPACRIRVVGLLDEAETVVPLAFDPEAMTAWVERRVADLHAAWLRAEARRKTRRELAARLRFPFPEARPGQDHLLALVAEAVAGGRRLLLQAPTGLGKTAAVLHPALVQALAGDQRVFYCTPRNSQHEVAEAYVRRLVEAGHPVRSVTIRAKERVCPQPEVDCRPEACPRAAGYYDRLRETGAAEALLAGGCADAAAVRAEADRHLLCPHELSLDAARGADVVIGDYNYAFSPNATLIRFFGTPEEAARNLVLVDEAHNLPARAADWFSPGLDLAWLEELRARKALPAHRGLRARLTAQLKRCQALLRGFEGEHRVLTLDPSPFLAEELRIARILSGAAGRGLDLGADHPLVALQRGWSDFCGVLRDLGEAHIVTWIPPGRLQITCADASAHLAGRMAGFAAAVLFSATLKPFDYHQRLAGLAEVDVLAREVPSPFPPAHRKVLVVPQVSTLYRRRAVEAPKIAGFLARVLPQRLGNYAVFFPSFDLLEQVRAHLDLPGFQVRAQPRRARAEQIEALVASLRGERGVVLLAVQGGSLSEGIDLPGEALIGCVVVGPPLPPFDLERDRMRAYFDRKYGQGQAYAYTYPAAAKAIQAAGRVIRTPQDRGLLIFLDGRFLEPDYAACFPDGWFQAPGDLVSRSILADVTAFWAEPG